MKEEITDIEPKNIANKLLYLKKEKRQSNFLKKENILSKSLGEALPKEQARVREILGYYKKIPQRAFGAALIEQSLKRADEAIISGDIAEMLAVYKELKEIN